MGIEPLGQHIRLPDIARGKLQLQAGDIVSVSVIKPLSSSYWAIGLKGLVFRAKTDLPLTAGEQLKAVVVKNGGHIELKLSYGEASSLPSAFGKAGFGNDPLTVLLLEGLVKWRMKIEEATVRTLRQKIGKMNGDSKKNARTLGLLIAKGLKPESPHLLPLASLLDFGSRQEPKERPLKKQSSSKTSAASEDEIVQELKKTVRNSDPQATGLLGLLNHLAAVGERDHWIVVPFRLKPAGDPLEGTLRFLYDRFDRKIKKAMIVTYPAGGGRNQFTLLPGRTGFRLSVSSNQDRLIGRPLSRWPEIVANLAKLGVQSDDSIKDDSADDGFEPPESGPAYQSVDLTG